MVVPNPRAIPACGYKGSVAPRCEWQEWKALGWFSILLCANCGRTHLKDTRPRKLKECLVCKGVLEGRKYNWCGNRDCIRLAIAHKHTTGWREYIRHRDKCCKDCGVAEGDMEAHHILPVSQGGIECDPDNGVLLCAGCHKGRHRHLPR